MRTYLSVYAALLALTASTLGASRVDLAQWNIVLALAIAGTKGLLVVLFFMHLKDHGATNRAYVVVGLFFVTLLTAGTIADAVTRLPTANPPAPRDTAR